MDFLFLLRFSPPKGHNSSHFALKNPEKSTDRLR